MYGYASKADSAQAIRNPYDMVCHTKKFEIERIQEDSIIRDIRNSSVVSFNALNVTEDQTGIYLKFVNLDYSDENSILDFCNYYGLLYVDLNEYTALTKRLGCEAAYNSIEHSMKISDFIKELVDFRYVVELYSCLYTVDIDPLTKLTLDNKGIILALDNFVSKHERDPIHNSIFTKASFDLINEELVCANTDYDAIKNYILAIVRINIKKHVENIHFRVDPEVTSKKPQLQGTLLDAMYFRFYMDMMLDIPVRLCRNDKCSVIFATYYRYGGVGRIYCSDRCCKNHGMRMSRKRRQNKK